MPRSKHSTKPMTAAEDAFARDVARDGDQSAAFRKHFPQAKGWKDNTVWVRASQLAARKDVTARVDEYRARGRAVAEQRYDYDLARWLGDALRLALYDPRRAFNDDGSPKLPKELDDDTAMAVTGIKIGKDGSIDYRFAPRTVAMEQIGRHLGAFLADNRQKADTALAALMQFVAERGGRLPVRHDVEDAVVAERAGVPALPEGALAPRG